MKAAVSRAAIVAPAYGHQLAQLQGEAFDLAIALAPTTARFRPREADAAFIRARWSESLRYENSTDSAANAAETVACARRIFEATVGGMFLDGAIEELES